MLRGVNMPKLTSSTKTTTNTKSKASDSPNVISELGNHYCGFCGGRNYNLVLRVKARSPQASLVAKCSRCDEEIVGYSVERLHSDLYKSANVNH